MGISSQILFPMCLEVTIVVVLMGLSGIRAAPPAQFIFGDSLVDQGNNNNLNSLAKANFKPFGIDLAIDNFQPTGRFCNGRIVSDFLSEYLGVPPVLAFNDANAKGANLLRGCNFGSAGAGILDDTGTIFGSRVTFTQQIDDFRTVVADIKSQLGDAAGTQLLSEAIYDFTIGGNDYINNYLLPAAGRSFQYNMQQFTALLIATLKSELQVVYNLGARKITVSNVGPLGCIPDQLARSGSSGACLDNLNKIALDYNALLKPMLQSLTAQLPGSTFIYIDAYAISLDFIQNPAQYGFTNVNTACCGTGNFNGLIPCTAVNGVCPDRSVYLFWDPFHPTDSANRQFAQKILFGSPSIVSPINVDQLIKL